MWNKVTTFDNNRYFSEHEVNVLCALLEGKAQLYINRISKLSIPKRWGGKRSNKHAYECLAFAEQHGEVVKVLRATGEAAEKRHWKMLERITSEVYWRAREAEIDVVAMYDDLWEKCKVRAYPPGVERDPNRPRSKRERLRD